MVEGHIYLKGEMKVSKYRSDFNVPQSFWVSFKQCCRYKNALIWNDMTVAYVASPKRLLDKPCAPCCGVLDETEYDKPIVNTITYHYPVRDCFDKFPMTQLFHLCERETTSGKSTRKTARPPLLLQPLDTDVLGLNRTLGLVVCRTGHFTHCFLTVDRKASCWEHGDIFDRGGITSKEDESLSPCLHTMTLLRVHFECVSGSERLPYTLVCDRRQDCWDNSDEEFCVFPSCTEGGPQQCPGKQKVVNIVRIDG